MAGSFPHPHPARTFTPGYPTSHTGSTETDDSSWFCNVSEHHDLEDYIYALQQQVEDLKNQFGYDKAQRADRNERDEKTIVNKLVTELQDRKHELEALDLAIERQKKEMQKMRDEERNLINEKTLAKEELEFLRLKNNRSEERRKLMLELANEETAGDMSYGDARARKRSLLSEIQRLENTLSKRKWELNDTIEELDRCTSDLNTAQEQSRKTIRQHDQASAKLAETLREAKEIDQRANEAGIQLAKTNDMLTKLRADISDNEATKSKQEKVLTDINQVISKKDMEFQDISRNIQEAKINSEQMLSQLGMLDLKQKQFSQTLAESEALASKQRTEISRLRDEIDNGRRELEKIDQNKGQKHTELGFIEGEMMKKKSESERIIRETDIDIAQKLREIKEKRDLVYDLEKQQHDLNASVQSRRSELSAVKSDIDVEQEVVQKLAGMVVMHKSELKNTQNLIEMEKRELENLRSQHAQKLAEIDRVQKIYLQEKSQQDLINTEIGHKQSELDRLRQIINHEKSDLDTARETKLMVEQELSELSRQRNMHEANNNSILSKIQESKGSLLKLQNLFETSLKKLDDLEADITSKETEVDKLHHEIVDKRSYVEQLHGQIKGGKNEIEALKADLIANQQCFNTLEYDYKETFRKREEIKLEIDSLNESIKLTKHRQEAMKLEEQQNRVDLNGLIADLRKKHEDHDNIMGVLNTAVHELDNIHFEIDRKKVDYDLLLKSIDELKSDAERCHHTRLQVEELTDKVAILEGEVSRLTTETVSLSTALEAAQTTIKDQSLEHSSEKEALLVERESLLNHIRQLDSKLELSEKELDQLNFRSRRQVADLEKLAENHFSHANHLTLEVSELKRQLDRKSKVNCTEGSDVDTSKRMSSPVLVCRSRNCGPLWKRDALKQQLIQEQNLIRQQLQQQMNQHADSMEQARIKSQETVDNLRQKLDDLQQMLVQTRDPSPITTSHPDSTNHNTNSPNILHDRLNTYIPKPLSSENTPPVTTTIGGV